MATDRRRRGARGTGSKTGTGRNAFAEEVEEEGEEAAVVMAGEGIVPRFEEGYIGT